MGRTEKVSAEIIVQECDLPISPEDFIKEFRADVMDLLPHVPLMPGAERLINYFYNIKLPMAIATSSDRDAYDVKTSNLQQVFQHIHHVVCGGTDPEVEHSKPEPDIYLICASRFDDKPKPRNVLVFEDSIMGLQSGLAAKMQVIFIPNPVLVPEDYAYAPNVFKTMNDFKPELFGLPPLLD